MIILKWPKYVYVYQSLIKEHTIEYNLYCFLLNNLVKNNFLNFICKIKCYRFTLSLMRFLFHVYIVANKKALIFHINAHVVMSTLIRVHDETYTNLRMFVQITGGYVCNWTNTNSILYFFPFKIAIRVLCISKVLFFKKYQMKITEYLG